VHVEQFKALENAIKSKYPTVTVVRLPHGKNFFEGMMKG
jgi:hypothetical protein